MRMDVVICRVIVGVIGRRGNSGVYSVVVNKDVSRFHKTIKKNIESQLKKVIISDQEREFSSLSSQITAAFATRLLQN